MNLLRLRVGAGTLIRITLGVSAWCAAEENHLNRSIYGIFKHHKWNVFRLFQRFYENVSFCHAVLLSGRLWNLNFFSIIVKNVLISSPVSLPPRLWTWRSAWVAGREEMQFDIAFYTTRSIDSYSPLHENIITEVDSLRCWVLIGS